MLQVFSQSLFGLQLVSFNMHCPGVRHGNFHDVGNSPGENPEHEGKTMFCMGKRAPNSGSWSREEHSHLQDLGTATPEVTGNQTQGETSPQKLGASGTANGHHTEYSPTLAKQKTSQCQALAHGWV